MNSFEEAISYLESVFGSDFYFQPETRGEGGDQVIPIVRLSDNSYLGYLAAQLCQETPTEGEGAGRGRPFLDVKIYLDFSVCRMYFQK